MTNKKQKTVFEAFMKIIKQKRKFEKRKFFINYQMFVHTINHLFIIHIKVVATEISTIRSNCTDYSFQ